LDQVQSEIAEDDSLEQICTVSETPDSIVTDTSLVVENVVDVAIENKAMPSMPIKQESSTYMLVKGDSSTSDLEVLSSQVRFLSLMDDLCACWHIMSTVDRNFEL
jgi:hypothetical protein